MRADILERPRTALETGIQGHSDTCNSSVVHKVQSSGEEGVVKRIFPISKVQDKAMHVSEEWSINPPPQKSKQFTPDLQFQGISFRSH